MTIKANSSKVSYSDERVIAPILPQYSNMILEFYMMMNSPNLQQQYMYRYIQVHM